MTPLTDEMLMMRPQPRSRHLRRDMVRHIERDCWVGVDLASLALLIFGKNLSRVMPALFLSTSIRTDFGLDLFRNQLLVVSRNITLGSNEIEAGVRYVRQPSVRFSGKPADGWRAVIHRLRGRQIAVPRPPMAPVTSATFLVIIILRGN